MSAPPSRLAHRHPNDVPVTVRLARRAYGLLLPLMPPSTRRHHGREMHELFADLCADAHRAGGKLATLRFTLVALGRLIVAGPSARWQARRISSRRSPEGPSLPPDGGHPLRGVLHDLRHGLRALRRSPSYVALVVITLGLAVGTNVTIFSMVRMVLAPPLPFADPDTLVFPIARNPELNRARSGLSLPDLEDLAAAAHSLRGLAAERRTRVVLSSGDRPIRVEAMDLTAGYFRTAGIEPEIGRLFLPEETAPGSDRVVLLSHGGWERRFGADPRIVGRQVLVDGTERRIVGVLPESLEFGSLRDMEIYRPLPRSDGTDRGRRDLTAIARLAPGVTLEQARAELEELSRGLQQRHPEFDRAWEITVLGLREALLGPNVTIVFSIMSLAVAFILLIACVNVANLTMARAARRRQEMSLRVAMGARRWRLVREQLLESALLALAAGAAGVALAHWIFALLVWIAGDRVSLFGELRIDGGVLAFALGLSLVTPILFALWPALRVSGRDLAPALRSGGRGGEDARDRRTRRMLVVAQVALAVALLLVAGLVTRSIHALLSIDLGFDAENLLTLRIERPETEDAAGDARGFFLAARRRIAAVPGVRAVGLASHRPIVGGEPVESLTIDGRDDGSRRDGAVAAVVVVDPGFFTALAIPLQRGRPLGERDDETAAPVAVISRAAADRYWARADPVGARVRLGGPASPWRVVVGVVADLRNPDADRPPEPHVYVPFSQSPSAAMAVLVRTATEPADLADAVRAGVWQVDPQQPLDDVRTMARIHYDDFASDLAVIGLVALFALVACALAVAGIYGVVSYAVSQRTREIGIRMAVGARSADVRRQITRQGLTPVLAGIGLGLLLGLGLARVIGGTLYGISETDPFTFVTVPVALAVVGLVASVVPARRAARLDPAQTLRVE